MGKQGSERSQLSSQLRPLLKERRLGEKGVKVRSWSIHWPNRVKMWVYSLSLTKPSSFDARIRLETSLT